MSKLRPNFDQEDTRENGPGNEFEKQHRMMLIQAIKAAQVVRAMRALFDEGGELSRSDFGWALVGLERALGMPTNGGHKDGA